MILIRREMAWLEREETRKTGRDGKGKSRKEAMETSLSGCDGQAHKGRF